MPKDSRIGNILKESGENRAFGSPTGISAAAPICITLEVQALDVFGGETTQHLPYERLIGRQGNTPGYCNTRLVATTTDVPL